MEGKYSDTGFWRTHRGHGWLNLFFLFPNERGVQNNTSYVG
jgi:hypothetical protein